MAQIKENTGFFLKVTFAHVVTYMVCGMIAMKLFGYLNWIADQSSWRDMGDPVIMALPLFQIGRGVLYGIVLLLLKDSIVYSKYGIIKLYVILIILGIFNTPAPSPGSIEGFVYLLPSEEPLRVKLGGMTEILTQNLLFCIIVCTKWKGKKIRNEE